MNIELAVVHLAGKHLDVVFRISQADSRREIARVKTGCVAFHLGQRQAVEIPDRLKEKLDTSERHDNR